MPLAKTMVWRRMWTDAIVIVDAGTGIVAKRWRWQRHRSMRNALVCHSVPTTGVRISSTDEAVIHTIHRVYLVNWSTEILFCNKVGTWSNVLKSGVLQGGSELVVHDIGNVIVRHKVV